MKPIIAILAYKDHNRMRGNKENFVDLIRTGHKLGAIVYVTTAGDLNLSEKTIVGYEYDNNNKTFISRKFPLPCVVYNRIPYRKYERTPEVRETIQACLADRRIRLFNPFFFNKWKLYEWLSKSDKTRPFLPVTEELLSSKNLDSLFKLDCSMWYVKPVSGKAGNGIIRVERNRSDSDTKYRIIFRRGGTQESDDCASITELWEMMKRIIGNKKYVVQQGIELARYRERPFDLRLLVQKNSIGEWAVTGVGARVAGKRSITTHVPRGGSIRDPRMLLKSLFGTDKAEKIMRHAHRSALLIASRIEKEAGHTLGEMSMDIGVDTNGSIWFFEANSKPMKFDEPHIRRKSLSRIIQYCMFLCGDHKNSR
ncbi:YheC/YheD family protein [Paenibacillus mesophilus]|uniref:YheC/YheD family endospore coat-associated protein n=1 Tax=Paenibacillus mesophilus TaxID=2582849 RepID=UPI00110F3326|nr:YheC/YheD family protein [Paenibacillus mesophilus]TMV48620.1 YheC/YheD family protein [Paenibacillus mesophilus]